MNIGRYAPSAQFMTIALSLLLSTGLVYAAERLTNRPPPTLALDTSATPAQTGDAANWTATLDAIQANNASSSLAAPNPDLVNQFLQAAQSSNLTDTVARTLFVNLSSAKSQGLGDDTPTQNQIIAAAAAQASNAPAQGASYSYSDLTIVSTSEVALHAYGNAVMTALSANPNASEKATLLSIDAAVEGGDKNQASVLALIGAAYKADAKALLTVPVPQTLAPFELQAINNFLATSATFGDMEAISTDPVRGLRGLQAYENLMDTNASVFINIAQELHKDGILFTKDEPGSAWSLLMPAPTVSASQ
jgi:hypothetical protein